MTRVTPVRKQYLQIKRQHSDAILFFRLGDFYETFDQDAETVSRELDIVLTSRNVAKNQRVPMAGVPYHAVEGYIARLITKGYKVAICEQVGEVPKKGLVHREVVRVVTPGTVVEPSLLEEKKNNYLAAVVADEDRAGVAYVDITTGEFATTQIADREASSLALQELARIQPRECLLPEGYETLAPEGIFVTPYDGWRFELGNARGALLDHFQVASLAGFGCEGLPSIGQFEDFFHRRFYGPGCHDPAQPGTDPNDRGRGAGRLALVRAGCDGDGDGRAVVVPVDQSTFA